jgi:hypothetical protein
MIFRENPREMHQIAAMIRPDIYHKENVLHLSFSDRVQLYHFEELKPRLPAVFRCLRPDFTLLTDLSGVEEIDIACCKPIGELMEQVVDAGVGQVMRVVPDPRKDIGLNILAAFHYPKTLRIKIYNNLNQAMEELGIASQLCYQPAMEWDSVNLRQR